jgi:hypothetical protein
MSPHSCVQPALSQQAFRFCIYLWRSVPGSRPSGYVAEDQGKKATWAYIEAMRHHRCARTTRKRIKRYVAQNSSSSLCCLVLGNVQLPVRSLCRLFSSLRNVTHIAEMLAFRHSLEPPAGHAIPQHLGSHTRCVSWAISSKCGTRSFAHLLEQAQID